MLADDEGIMIDSLKYIIEKEFGDECCEKRHNFHLKTTT